AVLKMLFKRDKFDAAGITGSIRTGGELTRARAYARVPFGLRDDFVDEPPFDRFLTPHTFFKGTEHVGTVSPHLALVGDTGQASSARQHGKQRSLGERNSRPAIIHQHDVIGRECELVTAARA